MTDWFPNNFMKVNEDKYHLMIFSPKENNEISIKVDEACVKKEYEENFLEQPSINP